MTKQVRMTWDRLLSSRRLFRTDGPRREEARTEFQRDFDRLVFSSAFRRMQDKTQVFPLAESDYVRTRLTHSIEVASVGRSLGTIVGNKIEAELAPLGLNAADIGAIVAAACLAHDIGNPPFGHSGEEAIRYWFSRRGKKWLDLLTPMEKHDFVKFEGNAQGFRLLTRLLNSQNAGGLELTAAVLGAFTKYPRSSNRKADKGVSGKKFGFSRGDAGRFRSVAEELGLIRKPGKDVWCRHPLAFLVEAADDICYRIVDFEDGVRLGLVSFERAESLLIKLIGGRRRISPAYSSISDKKDKIEYLRALCIGALIKAAAGVFTRHLSDILMGRHEAALLDGVPRQGVLNEIKSLSKEHVYTAKSVLQIEAAGFEVLGGLLDLVVPAIVDSKTVKLGARETKIRQLVPPQFLKGESDYEKIYSAVDFVAGMTDSFALTLYRRVSGIELPRAG